MYPSEFEAAETGFTRVDAPLFLGLPPLLGVILVLTLLLVAVAMFLLGRWQATRAGGADADRAPEEIYALIRLYATEARAAGSHELRHKAEVLARKIDDCLGPVTVVGRDLGALTRALKAAGEGRVDAPAKPVAAEVKPTPTACGCTPGKPCACAAPPVSINQIYIGGQAIPPASPTPAPIHPAGDPKPAEPPAPPPVKIDMTHQQQIDALDRAVRAFHDHWLNRDARIAELKAAQAALNRRPSVRDLRGSHASHGGAARH